MNSNFAQKWYFFLVLLLIQVSSFQICWNYFFLTTGSDYIRSGRRPIKKITFWAKFLSFYCFFLYVYMQRITKKFFRIFVQFWPKYLKKWFLSICHAPSLILLARMVQICSNYAQNDRNDISFKLIESFYLIGVGKEV